MRAEHLSQSPCPDCATVGHLSIDLELGMYCIHCAHILSTAERRDAILFQPPPDTRGYREFLSGDNVPQSVTLAYANGADNWEELVYALGGELDSLNFSIDPDKAIHIRQEGERYDD